MSGRRLGASRPTGVRPADGALHVAALPFPTSQGTQAAIAAMLTALAGAGRDASLLTYAHGAPGPTPPFTHHRLAHRFGDRSLRSGPSIPKLLEDTALAHTLARLRPPLVIAHHVEAAAACVASRVPFVFVAHTALGPELPTYLPSSLGRVGPLVARAGTALDRALARRARAALAVSPALAARLREETGVPFATLPIPWPVPPEIGASERAEARRALGLDPRMPVALYAGNLDEYQGIEALLDAVLARPALALVLATDSIPSPAVAARLDALDAQVRRVPLDGEPHRRALHAAADLVVVPRAAEGGVPVKLLDALARGVPVVASPRALGGLPIEALVHRADESTPAALAAAIDMALHEDATARAERTAEARAWVARAHGEGAFLAALDAACERAHGPASTPTDPGAKTPA